MINTLRRLIQSGLLVLKPALSPLFLRDNAKIDNWEIETAEAHPSAMVTEFSRWHKLLEPFFRRVRVPAADVAHLKELNAKGPIVYVMKNRGQLEYRYFNHLFLNEGVRLSTFANGCYTRHWWPAKTIQKLLITGLRHLYRVGNHAFDPVSTADILAREINRGHDVFLNLRIPRDYLFGVLTTSPFDALKPLISVQKNLTTPIHLVPVQFLYDKHPEKTERSFFDLMFGDKSCPGAIRKILLLIMNYRKNPQAKFGTPIPLADFIAEHSTKTESETLSDLFNTIEDSLSIERARITGPKLCSRSALIKEILADPLFETTLKTLATESGQNIDKMRDKARRELEEIAADINYSYVQFGYVALTYLWNTIYDGLAIKPEQLERLRELAGKNPIVLVPMHRSHIDGPLMSYIFYQNNITYPHSCAGINLNFWPAGPFIRRSGGFFIRRKLDDPSYKESLFAYLRALLQRKHCVAFFIEGTRSRTGKMLKPKMGILGMTMHALWDGACEDIHYVPIAINYDQIIEQKSYSSEGAGAEKSGENAFQLMRAGKLLNRKYGKVYVEFAEPISLKTFLDNKEKAAPGKVPDQRKLVHDFAYHLTYHMNKAAVVTPMALVSLAVLSLEQKSFSFDDVQKRIALLKNYLDFKSVRYTDLILDNETWAYGEALSRLRNRHLLKEVASFEGSFYALDNINRGDLDYHKNNIAHFFVSLTCFCKIIAEIKPGENITLDQATARYEILKTLFRQDFTFSARETARDHLLRVAHYAAERGFIAIDETSASPTITNTITLIQQSEFNTFAHLLDNFLESHLLVLRYLRLHRPEKWETKQLIKDILEKSKPLYLKDSELTHPEALNRFNIENSLKAVVDMGVLISEDAKGKALYSTTADSADLLERWIGSIRGFMNQKLSALAENQQTTSKSSEQNLTELH